MNYELITIKELADVLETTKAKVNYAIKKNGVEVVRKENKFYLKQSDVDIITRHIKPTTRQNDEPTPDNTDLLKDVIQAKNEQIETLQTVIATLQKEVDRVSGEFERLTKEIEFKNQEILDLKLSNDDLRELLKAKETKTKNWLVRIFNK